MLLYPRIPMDDAAVLRSPRARLALAYLFFGLGAVVMLIVALNAGSPLGASANAAFSAVCVSITLYFRTIVNAASGGSVRLQGDGNLVFVPPRALFVWPAFISVCGIVAGMLAAVAPALAGELVFRGLTSKYVGVMAVVCALWLGQQLWSLRRPIGLRVTREGLEGVRGSANVSLRWDELAQASADSGRVGARLLLKTATGQQLSVAAPYLGSDPTLVAAVVEHFREHPEHRDSLEVGYEAIAVVERASA